MKLQPTWQAAGAALLLAGTISFAPLCGAQAVPVHTAALSKEADVRNGFAAFYDMDYDLALQRFEQIATEHPDDPLATVFVLDGTVFKELIRLDLLDTTFYANDGFLSGKHAVVEDPAVRDHVRGLAGKVIDQADTLLAKDPKDVDALYARAWARALEAVYNTLVERSFGSALKLGVSAKNDGEEVLKLDPQYVDANLIVGAYQYVVGALPFSFRIVVGIAGITGSKEKGMEKLRNAADHGALSPVDARTCMMLFLRRETNYKDAESLARELAAKYPHGYLFQLELANLEKDSGDGPQAISQYKRVLAETQREDYFHSAHLELDYFGLGDTLRGQKMYEPAAEAYRNAAHLATTSPELKQRCLVAAGKSLDLMHDHARATENYQEAVDAGQDTTQGQEARKLIRKPYEGV